VIWNVGFAGGVYFHLIHSKGVTRIKLLLKGLTGAFVESFASPQRLGHGVGWAGSRGLSKNLCCKSWRWAGEGEPSPLGCAVSLCSYYCTGCVKGLLGKF
jgi:hypothetical protein